MAKSRNNKTHKERLNKFKTKRKQMSEQQSVPQFPAVRAVPTWDPNAQFMVPGYLWESIQNGLVAVQQAQQAAQAVMSHHIVNGTIKMDFEKLVNPNTGEYGPMTDEEKAEHVKAFDESIERVKTAQTQPQSTEVESAVILDETGEPVKKEAKVVSMDSNSDTKSE